MKKIFENNIAKLAVIAVVVFGLIFGVVSITKNWGKTKDTVNTEAALKTLDSLYNKLNVTKSNPKAASGVVSDDGTVVLPDISEYPFVVNPTTDNFLTIYSSPEKAGTDYESWLIDVAEKFNKSGVVIDGKPVSVGIRSISSGLAADFIASGKYKPDLFAPSNELWGDILINKGVNINLIEKRIAGNVAGFVLSKSKNDELVKKYGALNSKIIIDSVLNGELVLGYTDPLSSSTGLNLLLTAFYNFDPNNPLSDASIAQFQKFQNNIPYVAYNTMQMRDSAAAGTLDGFVLEYQTYVNTPNLKSSYTFIPFGVRHDQPIYEVGDLSALKKQIATSFVDYCKTSESQKMATEKGFNGFDDYTYASPSPDGATILKAQETWKKEKSGTSGLTAVFVADVSGSMDGSPLLKLKASLNRAATFIDSNTNIGFVTFSDNVNIALPIAKFDGNQKSYFINAVKSMKANGGTAMFDAVIVGSKMLIDAQKQNPNTKLMLFILTDGETNRGNSFDDVESMVRGLKIPIYTIGYNEDIEILQKLSDINEATTMNAETDNVIYKLESLFNSQM